MQVIKSKRTQYDPVTYGRMTGDLTRLMDATPHLTPERDLWDVEGDWSKAGALVFIDRAHMASFQPFANFDCRVIKLINFDKPAVRLTFYFVHRYWVLKDKDLPIDERERQVEEYTNMLTVKIEMLKSKEHKLSGQKLSEAKGQIAMMEQERTNWQSILDNLDKYEMAISNYDRQHTYTQVNFKYEAQAFDYANEQEHLLSNQRDFDGNITQARYNIIFVDPIEILRDHPYQNKKVDRFLARFGSKSLVGRNTLYARLRNPLETEEVMVLPSQGAIGAENPQKHPTEKKKKGAPKGLPKEVDYEPLLPLFPDWSEIE